VLKILSKIKTSATSVIKANGERIIKKSELGETQYVSANYIVRNKTVISKHVFAGNQRIASTVSMKNNCGTMTEQNTMYFHPDHLGSSSYVTDKKGNFFEMIEYLPYGETLYDEAATVDKTEFRFTSKEMDAETGLYYYGARYRDAKTGVWLSVDPYLEMYLPMTPISDKEKEHNMNLPGLGGVFNSVNLNLYHYAGNNPVRFVDPDGKQSVDILNMLFQRIGVTTATELRINEEIRNLENTPFHPHWYGITLSAYAGLGGNAKLGVLSLSLTCLKISASSKADVIISSGIFVMVGPSQKVGIEFKYTLLKNGKVKFEYSDVIGMSGETLSATFDSVTDFENYEIGLGFGAALGVEISWKPATLIKNILNSRKENSANSQTMIKKEDNEKKQIPIKKK